MSKSKYSQDFTCPTCEGKAKNKGLFQPRYFRLKDGSEVGYIYHQVVDNQGRLRQHSIGVKAPPRRPKSDISKEQIANPFLLDISEIETLKKLHTRLVRTRNKSQATILEKIIHHFS